MTEPAGDGAHVDLSSLTFSDAGPLPDDAPDFTASADVPTSPLPPTAGTSGPPRKRRLPGRMGPILGNAGTKDNGTRREREKVTRPERPLPPIPAKGFAPGVEKMYHALALAVTPFDVELGKALDDVAEEASLAWDELARQNHMVRRFLVAMMETTAWGQVIAAHAPLVGLAFARMMGTSTRQTMLSAMMAQQAEAHLRAQQNGSGQAE